MPSSSSSVAVCAVVSASAAGYVVPTDIGQSRRRETAADYSKKLGG